jgi:glycogen debranching enzyme
MQTYLELLNEASEILRCNTITVTVDGKPYERAIPSRDYYVHQWLWDSAGIAMGLVHINEEAAFNEIISLIAGQWNNGLIPHIIYNPGEARYYPPADQWQTTRFTRNGIKTSGITDPPLLAIAAEYICAHASVEQKKRDFIKNVLPSIMAYHDYLKRYRDPEDCGLLTIVHPWESGTDDSPRWDSVLNRIDLNMIPTDIKTDVDLNRKDIRHHNSQERPIKADYYRYIYLIELFKDLAWDYTKIIHETPFAVKDILFNSIWERANEALVALLHTYGNQEEANTYQRWAEQTRKALTNTWSQEYNQYCDKERYWRGPTWPITNFFIIEGLKRYKARHTNVDQLANFLMEKTIQMISDNGFWEYFDPTNHRTEGNGKGMGFSSFSWTAAILIQLMAVYFGVIRRP